jgi:subfamily B ATP-binding cassette protein MsbA
MNNILTVYQFGRHYLRRYWGRLVLGLLFGVVFGLSNASFIWASRMITGRFSDGGGIVAEEKATARAVVPLSAWAEAARGWQQRAGAFLEVWLPRAGRELDWRQIVGGLLFLPLLVGVRSAADYLGNYCIGWVSERVICNLRLDIMARLSALSLDFFNRSSTGDLITRINTDSMNLLRCLRVGGAELIKESITCLAVFIGLCWLDWRLTLFAMALLVLCLFPLLILGKKARWAGRANRDAGVLQAAHLVELLGGIRVVKAFNLEEQQLDRFRRTSGEMLRSGMKGLRAKELVNPIIEVISVLGFSLLMLYVFKTGRSGADMVGFLTGMLMFFIPVKKLASVHILFEQASVGVTRLAELFREEPRVKEPANPKPLARFQNSLAFDNVSFAYADREVLKDLTLTIPRGLKLGIAGESGSGKTTLVNLLFRFHDPTRGAVLIDGLDLREVSLRDLRRQLALVSQDIVLFDQTVAENIACGKPGATRAEVEAAARAAFAHDFIRQLPQGYDTRIGERGVTLSGGQRQRLAIARAFIRDAPILVLDEATASLDSKAEAEVQAAIDRLAEHRTVICVAHRLSTLAGMDRIVVLSEGRIIEQGGFNELLAAGGAFAAMANRQGIFAESLR